MDGATELRFEDLSKRSQAQLLAPLSEHELLQQLHQQTEQGSMQRGNEQTQNPAQDSSVEGRSAASRQDTATRRPPSRGPAIRFSGPNTALYALAYRPWGGREDDGSRRQHGDEGRGSPASNIRRTAAARRGGSNRRPRPAMALTRDMCVTYSTRNPLFRFTPNVPRRVLTVPSEGAGNGGLDNGEFNLIGRVNDILEAPGTNYSVLDLLGQGTFGQVFRCQDHATKEIVAIKVVKNKPAYRNQALLEIEVAKLLNERYDPNDSKNIVRLLDCFQFRNHLCLVFELLSINLYELLKQNQFRGLSLSVIRNFIKQILEALGVLQQANVIHCDLKPENVLLMSKSSNTEDAVRGVMRSGTPGQPTGSNRLKVIDFGSACYEGQTMYSYIQSRFYRSPEVLLGLPYDGAIDIWSLGCISLELFLGLPIFPGVSDHNQICRIVEMVGSLPEFMLENGKDTLKFFKRVNVQGSEGGGVGREGRARGWRMADADMAVSPERDMNDGSRDRTSKQSRGRGYKHVLKTPGEYARDTGTTVPQLKKYFKHSDISDIVQAYPLPGAHRRGQGGGNTPDAAQEKEARRVFTHFVLGLLNPNPWKRWTPKQAASHPFITGQPHPRDLGALTIADDPLVNDRYTRQMQAMQLKQHKDQQEAERKHTQRLRQHQRQHQEHRQQQEQQQREQRRGMTIPGSSSQPRHLTSVSGVGTTSAGTPGSIGSHNPYHASPLQQHMRRGSGDIGLMAMQIAHTPGRQSSGGDYGEGSISRPIDVPAGSGDGGGGSGMEARELFSRESARGHGLGGGQDLLARSMGYNQGRGVAGTSYPPLGGDDVEPDSGRGDAYSYSAASFSMGGASGNYVASDFGYALQRPGLRYEPTYKQSPPVAHSSSHRGPGLMDLGRRRGSDVVPSMAHPGSFTSHNHRQSQGGRGHDRGGRALSMDHNQPGALQYYMGGGLGGGVGGQMPVAGGGHFGPQSLHYPRSIQQVPSSVSTSTAGPSSYTPLAPGVGFIGPHQAFHSDAPQASVPWVRAGRGIGHNQPSSGGPRAQSTSPLFGRPIVENFPSGDPQDPSTDGVHACDGVGGGGGESWTRRIPGVESDELAESARQARHTVQRGNRQDHRRGLATDPDSVGEGVPFSFQLDDGRIPPGGCANGSGGMLGGSSRSSPLDWVGVGGIEDPEGVHKRSLNGTSKGIPSVAGGAAGISSSPGDEGDLIRRVTCDDSLSITHQPPPQSESLLSQQLTKYQNQQQLQGPGQSCSRTPFGSAVSGGPPEQPPSPAPHQQLPEPSHSMANSGGVRSSGERWIAGRGGGSQQMLMDDSASDQGVGSMGVGGSTWVSSSSTRALRRRGSSGSSEFYFVDTLQQQGGGAGGYAQPPMSPAGPSSSRSIYPGRSHAAAGGTPSSFKGLSHNMQQGQQGHQTSMPPRPPRSTDSSSMGVDKGSWAAGSGEGSWGSRTSPLHTLHQHLPNPPRSMGGRGPGSWDERGAPDIMRSIHEGNPSPDT